jgi:hypothetical protein
MKRTLIPIAVVTAVGFSSAVATSVAVVSGQILNTPQVTQLAATPTSLYIKAPRTNADPRAKLVQDLRKYFREHPKERVRVVDDAKDAQFVVDVKRPDVTGSITPYVASGPGDDRIEATPVHVAAARVCLSDSDTCREFTASAKLRTMAMLQLAEQIAKHVTTTPP